MMEMIRADAITWRRIGERAQEHLRREQEHENKNKALGHSGLFPSGDTHLPEWMAGTPRYRTDSEVNVWCRMMVIRYRAPPYHTKTNKLATRFVLFD